MTARGLCSGHVFIASSLDGYIARKNGDLDWLGGGGGPIDDYGYNAFIATVDGIVMGRGTFEKVLSFDKWPYEKPVVIMSHTLAPAELRADLAGKVRITNLAPRDVMAELHETGWRNAYVDGGKIIQSFLRDELIADLIISRIPVLLGDGISLFGPLTADVRLTHIETRVFRSGLVQSKYQVMSSR